ncbi:MAG TPA: O-antigen ligase family protein [Blastocatellia bacterium]|jgi:O-antigen ligase|nr:O-antigen ligase family protein [Blastocatellia bacterium]
MSADRNRRPKREHLSKAIAFGLLLAVTFSTLAHGAVEPWSVLILEAIVMALVLLWAIKVFADERLKLTIPNTALPIVALLIVGLAQSAAFTDSSGRWLSLSKNVGYTRAAVVVLGFLLISFLIASNFFATRERLSALGHFLVIYGLAMALFALVQHFTWNGRFYWVRPTDVTSPFGPFANHNHFAGYMEMLIPLPVALIISRGAVRMEMRLLCAFAAIVMGVALVASLSRGGMISLAASMMFLMIGGTRLALRRERESRSPRAISAWGRFLRTAAQSAVVVAIVTVIGAGILWIGADPVISRVTQGQSSGTSSQKETFFSSRGWVWRDTLSMISANPVLGVGLGAYGTAFAIYSKSDGSLRVPQAHNDYLQVLADCGIVGGVIALWFIVAIFSAVARGMRSRDPLLAGLALGSGAGMIAILVHSLVDFNLQVPSNALLFLLLSAVASHIGAATLDSESLKGRGSKLEAVEAGQIVPRPIG